MPNLIDKTVVLTGGTGDLGKLVVRWFVQQGANVIMLDRNATKAATVITSIQQEFPHAKLRSLPLDLNELSQLATVVTKLQNIAIDYLFLNAGVYKVPLVTTTSGYNNVFQTNFIGQYYLVKKLLPQLQRTHGKVIAVGSIAHTYTKYTADAWDLGKCQKPSKVYGNAKRWLMFALSGLWQTAAATGVQLAIVHPGVTLTAMTNHYHPAINWLVKLGMKMFFPTPRRAVQHLISGVTTTVPNGSWLGPACFKVWGKTMIKKFLPPDNRECQQIFQSAEQIYKNIA